MSYSICIYCGHPKNKHWRTCSNCGTSPEGSDVDMAKSMILSTSYDENDKPFNTKENLRLLGDQLASGEPLDYDQGTIERLLEQKKLLDEEPVSPWGFVFFAFCCLVIPVVALVLLLT